MRRAGPPGDSVLSLGAPTPKPWHPTRCSPSDARPKVWQLPIPHPGLLTLGHLILSLLTRVSSPGLLAPHIRPLTGSPHPCLLTRSPRPSQPAPHRVSSPVSPHPVSSPLTSGPSQGLLTRVSSPGLLAPRSRPLSEVSSPSPAPHPHLPQILKLHALNSIRVSRSPITPHLDSHHTA